MAFSLRKIMIAALVVCISALEVHARWPNARPQLTDEERHGLCAVPGISAEARFSLLSTYEAEALSNVTIGSQDSVTETAGIEIEPGSEPLYVVLLSYGPIIWRFSGAVERLERVVIASAITGPSQGHAKRLPLAGATGVPAERVTFVKSPHCFRYFSKAPSINSAVTIARLKEAVGREPDATTSAYELLDVALPSGEVEKSPRPRLWHKLANPYISRFWPAGVVEIDPHAVVASQPAESYEVLPAQAGLAQLVEQGALEFGRSREYLIKRKIRYPAGLAGAHSVRFLLLRGVPEPDGDPGHSCVVSEETGEPIAGCRSR